MDLRKKKQQNLFKFVELLYKTAKWSYGLQVRLRLACYLLTTQKTSL